jgi:hypothetical protein
MRAVNISDLKAWRWMEQAMFFIGVPYDDQVVEV